MKRDSILHMNIQPQLKKELGILARADNRTLSNFVETVLADYAKRQQSKPEEGKEP